MTEFRISPTTQHEPAPRLLRPDAELAEVVQLYQHLRSFHGSVLDDGTGRHGFIIDVQNLSSSSKSVLVLNDLWGGGMIEATAASHLIVTNRADQRRMQVWRISYTDVPYLVLKFKSYWIEDGNTSDERLTAAFRRSPNGGKPCLGGTGIQETADIFVQISLEDGVFWWENSEICADVRPPSEPAAGDVDQWDREGYVVKADEETTRSFGTGN